jgi:hypothetical protein
MRQNMKKILILLSGVLFMASCNHDVVNEVDYNVTLDPANTYYAGEPVKFNFTGDVDNLLFYSGERGSQYMYRNRYTVPMEQVINATLTLEVKCQYGSDYDCLKVYASNGFDGLLGTDGLADRAKIKSIVDSGMNGWVDLGYEDLKANNSKWTTHEISLKDYMDNMTLAFHWCPPTNERTQRTVWIRGFINVELDGVEPVSQKLRDMECTFVMMDETLDPYHYDKGNGSMRIPAWKDGQPEPEQHVIMQGASANALPYVCDGWVFTKPQPLNKVANDKPIIVKNLQNYIHEYTYTWETPGTYKVVFVGRNENYASASEQIYEYTINILEKPTQE